LQILYESPKLELKEDLANFNYNICIPGMKPFAIHQVSYGYASLINIYMELAISSLSFNGSVNIKFPAIVLVDELEAHLHVSMQKRIFSILSQFFPNVQFMITTNSPIICTEKNAIVFDIGKKRILEHASLSLKVNVETYFNTSQHSEILINHLTRYYELATAKELTSPETDELCILLGKLAMRSSANFELYSELEDIGKKVACEHLKEQSSD
jgi:predicted ATPase